MDFQIFTGAVILVIDPLSQPSQIESYQEANDWALIQTVTQSLGPVLKSLECTAAGQASQLLEHLSTSRHGVYSGLETYEVVIPMFDWVRIHQPKRQVSQDGIISRTKYSSSYFIWCSLVQILSHSLGLWRMETLIWGLSWVLIGCRG